MRVACLRLAQKKIKTKKDARRQRASADALIKLGFQEDAACMLASSRPTTLAQAEAELEFFGVKFSQYELALIVATVAVSPLGH